MKVFNVHYLAIPFIDMPPAGDMIVCLDPQDRLGRETWAVVESAGDAARGGSPPMAKALFWDKPLAIDYANFLEAQ